MVRPIQRTVNCPNCGQPFNAILEQIIDTGVDPTAKERLLSGRVNLVSCPHCGFQGMISTPLMYHDPEHQLAIVYVPMELNLPQEERERMIGDMTNTVMRSMPEDAPKGYLLQPGTALTLQGLIDQVLEAEGITPEMIDAERRKVELIDQLAEAKTDEVQQLIEDNQDIIDLTFLQLLTAAAQSASQADESRLALRLLNIRSQLMETTEAGREMKAQEQAIVEANEELRALGDNITREKFVDLLVKAAGNPAKLDAFAALGRPLLDYNTFQLLSERIDSADSEEAQQLSEARDHLLEINAEYERQSQAALEEAVNTLRQILQAEDMNAAIQANLNRIDQTFMMVLRANIEEARRGGQLEVSGRLQQIYDTIIDIVQQSAPPEIQFINDLLSVETEAESLEILRNRQDELSPEFVDLMGEIINQLRQSGNEPAAQRLEAIRAEAATLV